MRPLPILLLSLALISCTPDEPLVTSFDDSWRYLATVPGGVASIRMPGGTVEDGAIWSPSEVSSEYPVHGLHAFRDRIYLLADPQWVIVLDRETLEAVDTIDTDVHGMPSGLAFANATTAYTAFPTTNSVGIIDLTVGSVVATIPVDGRPVDVSAVGNQICVAVQETDEAVIIDSRTNQIEARIALPSANPTYVEGISSTNLFAVATVGAGKVADDDREPTTPTLSFISIADRRIDNSVDLTNRESEGPSQFPFSLTSNSQGFVYVPVQQGLLFANSRSASRASLTLFDEYHYARYHPERAEIVTIRPDGRTIEVYNEFVEARTLAVSVPDSVGVLLGIAP